METKWYETAWRRNLVDMHIDDWDESFLSAFSPDAYYEYLKRAHVQAPMLYLQSHAGHCYFPTKVGHMHASFRGCEDKMRRLAELCRSGGMHVVGYYSLIYNTYEEDRHPEWRIIADSAGRSKRQAGGRYGHCCPNNPDYRAFVLDQIGEIADYFTLDGMFYDMLFWPAICRCEHCRARLERETGLREIPVVPNWRDDAWLAFEQARRRWMGEFASWVTAETKTRMHGVSVEHNYANAVAGDWSNGAGEAVNEACDYAGGDLYGDLYNHSFTAKYYCGVTKHPPFEYMTCRCDRTLSQHTVLKSEEALSAEVMLTAAHHGASLIIDAIDPVGTLDMRVADRVGRVFERQMAYEPYFRGDLIADTGVFYATGGRYNPDGQAFTNKTCAIRTVRTLIENHVPVGVIASGYTENLSAYQFIFAPAIAGITDADRDALVRYVREGGSLYFSGAADPKLLSALLGGTVLGLTEEKRTYMAPLPAYETLLGGFNAKYPLPFEYRLPLVRLDSGDGVAARITLPYTVPGGAKFASIHSDPPGRPTDAPALVLRKFGKGNVIWSAAPLEEDDRLPYRTILISLMRRCFSESAQRVLASAPRQVEIVSFSDGGVLRVSAVDLLYSDERLPVLPFDIRVRTQKAQVWLLPERTPVPARREDEYLCFTVDGMRLFSMFEIGKQDETKRI